MTGNGAGAAFAYDNENRLVPGSGGRKLSLAYNPLGRLPRTVCKNTRECLYEGDALVAKYDGEGNLVERYVHVLHHPKPMPR